jgi:hypothetical protein
MYYDSPVLYHTQIASADSQDNSRDIFCWTHHFQVFTHELKSDSHPIPQ